MYSSDSIFNLVRGGHQEAVRKLLNERGSDSKNLANAREKCETECSKYRDWGVPAEYEYTWSVLAIAIRYGWNDLASMLITYEADVNFEYNGVSIITLIKKYSFYDWRTHEFVSHSSLYNYAIQRGAIDNGEEVKKEIPYRSDACKKYGAGGDQIAKWIENTKVMLECQGDYVGYQDAKHLYNITINKVVSKILSVIGAKNIGEVVFNKDFFKNVNISKEDLSFIAACDNFSNAEQIDYNDLKGIKALRAIAVAAKVCYSGSYMGCFHTIENDKNHITSSPTLIEYMCNEFPDDFKCEDESNYSALKLEDVIRDWEESISRKIFTGYSRSNADKYVEYKRINENIERVYSLRHVSDYIKKY